MRVAAAAGLGFLLSVLWFDLMFDVQARGDRGAPLPADVLASIAGYYRRVTTAARPMNRLVAIAMLATLGALAGELVRDDGPTWVAAASLALTAIGVGLAAARTVRHAVRLGTQLDSTGAQTALARSIRRDHLVCLAAIGTALVLQLTIA